MWVDRPNYLLLLPAVCSPYTLGIRKRGGEIMNRQMMMSGRRRCVRCVRCEQVRKVRCGVWSERERERTGCNILVAYINIVLVVFILLLYRGAYPNQRRQQDIHTPLSPLQPPVPNLHQSSRYHRNIFAVTRTRVHYYIVIV